MRALVGVFVGLALPAAAAPVITEVAWMGSTASSSDEWIEIHNPDTQPIPALSDFVLIQGTTVRALPAQTLAEGGFFIIERQDTATA